MNPLYFILSPSTTLFQRLERFQRPYADCFIPENCRDYRAEQNDEDALSRELLHEHQKISQEGGCGKDCIEEVSRKEKPSQFDKMTKHSNLNLASQKIAAAYILLLHQSQSTQLFKMMLRNAWTAKTQGSLNLTNTHRTPILQKNPINTPIFPPKSIIKLGLSFRFQTFTLFCQYLSVKCLIIPSFRTIPRTAYHIRIINN
jgi:hypothetical protein